MLTSQMRVASLTRPGMIEGTVEGERRREDQAGGVERLEWGEDMLVLEERGMEEYKGPGGYGAFFIGESWLLGDLKDCRRPT